MLAGFPWSSSLTVLISSDKYIYIYGGCLGEGLKDNRKLYLVFDLKEFVFEDGL